MANPCPSQMSGESFRTFIFLLGLSVAVRDECLKGIQNSYFLYIVIFSMEHKENCLLFWEIFL